MKNIKYILLFWAFALAIVLTGCSLKEKVSALETNSTLLSTSANAAGLVAPAYAQMRQIYEFYNCWAMMEAPTDYCMFPQRGSNWGDGGQWKGIFTHTWDPNNNVIITAWGVLGQGVADCDIALNYLSSYTQTDSIKAYINEVTFLKCYYDYLILDFWGQFPNRSLGDFNYSNPPAVLSKAAGYNWLVTTLTGLISNNGLPAKNATDWGRANIDMARALLVKLYMNKGQYTLTSAYSGPTTGDWANAKAQCDLLINSGNYGFDKDYFEIFGPKNTGNSEIIFPIYFNQAGQNVCLNFWFFPEHYNQLMGNPTIWPNGGWNGPCVTPDFIQRAFPESAAKPFLDTRYQDTSTCFESGVNLGLQRGQQHGSGHYQNYKALTTDQNTPLFYTDDCVLVGAGEAEGVRVLKYGPNPAVNNGQANQYAVIRYSDIVLLRGEAEFNLGSTASALTDINSVRQVRGLAPFASLSLDSIYAERSRELYWEGHARQDAIRLGKFLAPHYNKAQTSDPSRIWYSIPASAISTNPNLVQNPAL
jgi:hypothetical protein